MPNWVYTSYKIESSDKDALKKLEDMLTEWTKDSCKKSDFGNDWLGNIVARCGIYDIDPNKDFDDNEIPECRGSITDHSYEDGVLTIGTETAWSQMDELWADLIAKYVPDAEVKFSAEYDEGYVSNYLKGYCIENSMYEGDDDYKTIAECMEKYFGDREYVQAAEPEKLEQFLKEVLYGDPEEVEEDLDELIEEFTEEYEDFGIHEWEYGDFEYSDKEMDEPEKE